MPNQHMLQYLKLTDTSLRFIMDYSNLRIGRVQWCLQGGINVVVSGSRSKVKVMISVSDYDIYDLMCNL